MAEGNSGTGPTGLDGQERKEVRERKSGSSRVIHEVIREEGEEELKRPAASLLFSGVVAGVAMTASILAKTYLRVGLPDAPWRPLVESFGYTLGFLIVVMGRMQLFTESTVTAVLPIAMKPGGRMLGQLMRLWGLVFVANMAGTLAVAVLIHISDILDPPQMAALMQISEEQLHHTAWHILMLGIPSGFLVGTIAWILPNARESAFWVVLALTYLIGLGGFSHVVAGSTESWLLWLGGRCALSQAIGGIILPSLIGNVIGGTGLFAVLAHGQVRSELVGAGDEG